MTNESDDPAAPLWRTLRARSNWGRWGEHDQLGLFNLIDPDAVRRGVGAVRHGRRVSLSREIAKVASHRAPRPAQHYLRHVRRDHGCGAIVDFYGLDYHGFATTHIDALNHVWGPDGMWGRIDPEKVIDTDRGVAWGDIAQWRDGLVTRGLMIDVPRHRQADSVEMDAPVRADEVTCIMNARDLKPRPGDCLVLYMGREDWERKRPEWSGYANVRPGLHGSCLELVRDLDIAVVVWDFNEARPNEFGTPWTMHLSIPYFGMAVIDNALLEPLAQLCRDLEQDEFMLLAAPLVFEGGTGAPINPIAIL